LTAKCYGKSLKLYENFQKKDGTEEETKPFTANRGWLHRFRNRCYLKNIVTGEATSADEEAAATFLAELKKITQSGIYDPRQVFNCDETDIFLEENAKQVFTKVQNMRQDLKHGRID